MPHVYPADHPDDPDESQEDPDIELDLGIVTFLCEPEPWKKRAACRGLDPGAFVLSRGRPSGLAFNTCNGTDETPACPVRSECLGYAFRTRSLGIWGGVLITPDDYKEED